MQSSAEPSRCDDGPAERVEAGVVARVPQDEVVHHLHGGGTVPEHQRCRAERVQQIVELRRQQRLCPGQRHQAHRGFDHEAQGAFGADDDAGEIHGLRGIDEGVEVVAADASQELGEATVDLARVRLGQRGNRPVRVTLDAACVAGDGQIGRAQRTEMRHTGIGQHHVQIADVIDGLAVDDRAGAARVVRDHPADGGAAGRRHVGREAEVMWLERGVEVVEHHAGLHAGGARLRIDREDAVEVLRGVEHQPGADRLAGLRGAAAARRQRNAVAGRHRHRLHDIVRGARDDDPARLDLIDAGVGRIQRA